MNINDWAAVEMTSSEVEARIRLVDRYFEGVLGRYIYHSPYRPPGLYGLRGYADRFVVTGGDGYVLAHTVIPNDICEQLDLVPIGMALGAAIEQATA